MIPRTTSKSTYEVRAYADADEQETLALLTAAMGEGPTGRRSREFFRWKHLDNPFGRSFMLVATQAGMIVGFRSFMRWRLRAGSSDLAAVTAVDTATHPDHQGQGIFAMLTRRAIEELRGEVDLVFNTPNQKSGPGYLKMGWVLAGQVPISIRVRRPVRFARGVRSLKGSGEGGTGSPRVAADTAATALDDERSLVSLLGSGGIGDGRLATPRTLEYLKWRYGAASGLDYRAVRHQRDGRLDGLAIFRVRPRGRLWEGTVCELICRPDDGPAVRGLLRGVMRSARVDHLTAHFPSRTVQRKVATRFGFVHSPARMPFMVNRLRPGAHPDPARLDSWALTLGDLEVF